MRATCRHRVEPRHRARSRVAPLPDATRARAAGSRVDPRRARPHRGPLRRPDGVGQRVIHASNCGITRDACVCCSMNSETSTAHGSMAPASPRQGSSRASRSNQPITASATCVASLSRSCLSLGATRPVYSVGQVGTQVSTAANGILLVDKAEGWTSHDVVAKARRALGTRKVGHAGTLDPHGDRSSAARLGPRDEAAHPSRGPRQDIHRDDQARGFYRHRRSRGRRARHRRCSEDPRARGGNTAAIRDAVAPPPARIEQAPSAVSAIKVDGKRAYDRVRAGEQVEPQEASGDDSFVRDRGSAACSRARPRWRRPADRGDRSRRDRELFFGHLCARARARSG